MTTPPPPHAGPGPGPGPGPGSGQFGTGQFSSNQFGTSPHGSSQFGTGQFSSNQFGTSPAGAVPYGWAPPAGPPPSRPSPLRPILTAVVGLALLVGAGIVVRNQVFPDLSAPIRLPATMGGLPQGMGTGAGGTVMAQDQQGRMTATSVYADDVVRPTSWAMVVASRTRTAEQDLDIPPGVTIRTVGKVHCTSEADTATLLGTLPQGAANLTRAGLTNGAVCWRGGRHYTAFGFALTATAPAQALAVQAVNTAWDAR